MKKNYLAIVLSFILILSSAPCLSQAESYEDVFVKDNIIDINIDISDADLQDMYDYAVNEEYHSADITIDGIKIENAGIRTKGNMTLSSVANSDSDRYSFRIKFDKYVKNQTFLGLDELCLNNCYSDASYMREYLHYEILEKLGVNVPKRSYCQVYINGELFGFYLAIEGLDDTFLEREFGENYKDGNLYKMEEGSTLEYKEDENYTYAENKAGKDTDLTEFKEFVKRLNEISDGEKGDIESILNVDSALKYIASNTVLCNYDSYSGNMHHNFYLYQDEQGIFTVIPWDFNMSFGGFNGNNTEVGIDTPFISGSLETLPLIGKLLSVEEYKEKYYNYIKEIMAMVENFEERVNELKAVIKPYIENDPTAFYTIEDFEKATTLQDETVSEEIPIEFVGETEKNIDNNPQQQRPDERGRGKGKPFGGTDSIINCIKDRLENLNAQFAGTAEKTTEAANDRRGPGQRDRQPGENMPEGEFIPPTFNENGNINDMNGRTQQNPDGNFPGGGQMQPPQSPNGQNSPQNGENRRPGGFPPGMNSDRKNNSVIRVNTDGHIISFETNPVIENDTTLVGFRAILESLGASVKWEEDTKTVTAVKDDTTIILQIGSDTAYVNDEAYTLLAAPVIIENSAMVPVRFISEQLGMKVSWNAETKLITISSK